MIINRIKSLFDPKLYHGWGRTRRFFEGWYFKVVNKNEDRAFAFIPGISMNPDGEKHSFVQVLDGKKRTSEYHRFSDQDFIANPRKFDLRVSENRFSNEHIYLNIPGVKGGLNFSDHVGWPDKWYSPGIMGPFAFVPFMECYHGILSLDHKIDGHLYINEEKVDFTGGKGYTEKDWGRSFPQAYIWIQTNHFSNQEVSFKASVARIPWLGSSFTGFIAGLLINGDLYEFTTYNSSHIRKLYIDDNKVELCLENSKFRLKLYLNRSSGTRLASPVNGFMGGHIFESMEAEIEIVLYDKKKKETVFHDKGRNAGLEIYGELN